METMEPIQALWPQLPAHIEALVLDKLPPNANACTFRLLSKAWAARFSSPEHTVVRLSQPVPEHAFRWRWGPQRQPSPYRTMTCKQRTQLLCLTAASGVLANLEVAERGAGIILSEAQVEAAAGGGHRHIIVWLRQRGCGWGKSLEAAARGGHQELCEWLLGQDAKWDIPAAVYAAVRGGHVGLMERLMERITDPVMRVDGTKILESAAEGCELAAFQQLYAKWYPEVVSERERRQQEEQEEPRGRQELLQQPGIIRIPLLAGGTRLVRGSVVEGNMIGRAAGSPTPDWRDKIVWLEGQGCPKVADGCAAAAALPDALERLTWLQQRGYPVGGDSFSAAAYAGNLAALELLMTPKMPHSNSMQITLAGAAGGHLAVVAWAVESLGGRIEELNWQVGGAAAASGNLELYWWLHERGVRLHGRGPAVESGCEEALEWLVKHQPHKWRDDKGFADDSLYHRAICNNDLATVRCLRRLGAPADDPQIFTECAARLAPLADLQGMVAEGFPVEWDRALEAVALRRHGSDRERVVAWLREERDRAEQGQAAALQQRGLSGWLRSSGARLGSAIRALACLGTGTNCQP